MNDFSDFTYPDGDLDSTPTKDNIVVYKQYVQDVLDFSSQYGSDISISYTAYNILGKPSKYPDYGDFPQTFVVRTYGKWWNEAPSRPVPIMPQNFGPIVSQDYIDLSFEVAVYPLSVRIYETYNPGSVVRIWAGDRCGRWQVLWEGPPQSVMSGSRMFRPRIQPINFPTKLIRLEFDQSSLDYYTELDAVLLVGTREHIPPDSPLFRNGGRGGGERHPPALGTAALLRQSSEESCRLSSHIGDSFAFNMAPFHNLLVRDLDRILKTLEMDRDFSSPPSPSSLPPPAPPGTMAPDDVTRCKNGRFSMLPDEVMLHIFSYLDLVSLYRVSQLNAHLHRLATDATLYTELNLRPYWPRVNAAVMASLAARAPLLQRLDLAWCGNYGTIDARAFTRLIEENGKLLTHLRLDCCKFIDNACVESVTRVCRSLRELTLRNCSKIDSIGFAHLATITTLERLDLYRTSIETQPLVNILRNSPHLKHINLGSCVKVSSMDEVAQALGEYNTQLVSVDFWKTYSLTPVGVRAIARCRKLEEVDFGWCLGVSIPGDCLSLLASSCPNLRKLFMVALRGILDKDLDPFILNCRRLEQVDLLGVRSISQEVCLRFLSHCPALRLLDVSFCDHISEADVQEWRLRYPHVSIKRSFQNENYTDMPASRHKIVTHVFSGFCDKMSRTKQLDPGSDLMETPLKRCLNTFDITLLGIGHMVGAGIYVLTGTVARDLAGPGIILSFMLAGVTSMLAAVCYAEFGARVPKAGSAYVYTYVSVGEFWAFVIGWNIILEHMIGAASVARAWSGYVDSLCGGAISNFTIATVGELHEDLLGKYPDFLAFFVCISYAVLLGVGVKGSAFINSFLTLANLMVMVVVIVVGFYYGRLDNWINEGGGFLPYGISGVVAGAATCFYAYVGFDSIATSGEEAKDPAYSIPLATVLSMSVVAMGYILVSAALTLMIPYWTINPNAALPEAFSMLGLHWLKYTVTFGALCGMTTTLFGSLFSLPRCIYAMAEDGLIFKFLGKVNRTTQVPVINLAISGFCSALIALLFDLEKLVEFMSIGTLLAYTIVSASVIILRYRPAISNMSRDVSQQTLSQEATTPQSVSTLDLGLGQGGALKSGWQYNWMACVLGRFEPGACCSLAVFIYICMCAGLCFHLHAVYQVDHPTSWWSLFTTAMFLFCLCACLFVIEAHEQNMEGLRFKVPLVPFVPGLSIFFNIELMANLNVLTWLRFIIWMAIGLLVYFLYGIHHSKEQEVTSSYRVLLTSNEAVKLRWGAIPPRRHHHKSPDDDTRPIVDSD